MEHTILLHTGVADYKVRFSRAGSWAPFYLWQILLNGREFARSEFGFYNSHDLISDVSNYVLVHFGPLVATQLDTPDLPKGF